MLGFLFETSNNDVDNNFILQLLLKPYSEDIATETKDAISSSAYSITFFKVRNLKGSREDVNNVADLKSMSLKIRDKSGKICNNDI